MSEKIEVVYIGPKPVKRITHDGRKLVFPRLKPVAVLADTAYHLLDIPTVFSTPEDAKERIETAEKEKAAEEKAKADAEAAKKNEIKAQSFKVMVDGEVVDISKHTTPKLKTIIAAEELAIDATGKKLPALLEEVRQALHEKHGNPEANEG